MGPKNGPALLPASLVILSTVLSLTLSVRIGALALAAGLAALALLVYLQRGTRTPWRSQKSDLLTLVSLALACALLALLLP